MNEMTDQPKFTPGPWIVFTSAEEWGCDTFVGTLTDTLFDVRPWKGPAWQGGNAFLIAAAPDLYAALEDAIWALANCAAALSAAGLESTLADPTPSLRAALAKARGQA